MSPETRLNNLRGIILWVLPRLSDVGLAELLAATHRMVEIRRASAAIARLDVLQAAGCTPAEIAAFRNQKRRAA
jgi:hypothetical protein